MHFLFFQTVCCRRKLTQLICWTQIVSFDMKKIWCLVFWKSCFVCFLPCCCWGRADCPIYFQFANGATKFKTSDMCTMQPDVTNTLNLCICVFHIWYMGMSYLISLNPMLLKNIAHVGSFKHFVFVYLPICVFLYFTFDIRECHIWYPWIPCF